MTPNLTVENVNKTVEFYRNLLDFEFVTSVPELGQLDWAMMKNGTVEIMFQSVSSIAKDLPDFAGKQPGGSLMLYARVENVKALFDRIQGKVTLVHGLQKTFYGMEEFTIRDLDGYFLTFATPIQ
jgi:uncharacterized glyoxalase superfamily protein PhnB